MLIGFMRKACAPSFRLAMAIFTLALPVGLLVLAVLDEELTTLQCALNGDKQLVNVRGLQEVGVRAALQALDLPRYAGSAGQHDHGHIAVEGADLAEKLDPVYARVEDVGHEERRSRLTEDLEPFAPVVGEPAGVTRLVEDLAQDFSELTVIVNNQDVALGHVNPISEGVGQRNQKGSDFSET